MVIIKEFQIVLPITVDAYKVGQLYAVAEASKAETGGGDGVEVRQNVPGCRSDASHKQDPDPTKVDDQNYANLPEGYHEYQYTDKIYHLEKKMPKSLMVTLKTIAPEGSMKLHEEAWNAYPYCRTVLTNPYMKECFYITITSLHLAGPPAGAGSNVHNLDKNKLKLRGDPVIIDVANDEVLTAADKAKTEFDPCKYCNPKDDHGCETERYCDKNNELPALKPGWWKDEEFIAKHKLTNMMTCYKLVEIKFKWWGLQGFVEGRVGSIEHRLFTTFHRQLFCTHYQWCEMTIERIREIEEQTKKELDTERAKSELRGTCDEE